MRLLVSNPDTLGDLVLRQPMYRALLDAGHELTLIVRPGVKPLVEYVAPGAKTIELPYEVYAHDLAQRWDQFGELFDAAKTLSPDALVIAPYRWTEFDVRLADELPQGVKRFGMSGHLYRGDPHNGRAAVAGLRFDEVAQVGEDAPEVEKNAALASKLLGESRELPLPRIECPPAHRERAAEILSPLGLKPHEYWIACVTGTVNVPLKAWRRENWAETLSRWPAPKRDRQFLFVGLASEDADVRDVRDKMDATARDRTRVWTPPGGTIDELIGLTALSSGYVGHDTGPMHIAAALGKPVLAVFGGGHKLRFQPAVAPSVTVTVGVSCRGCEWICSFSESHCVKAVPIDEVLDAAEDLEAGRVKEREARVLEPTPELQKQMIRESARIAEDRLRESVEASRQLHETTASWNRDVAQLRADRDELRTNVEHVRADAEKRVAQAVQEAHAELGTALREKESMIRQQDEQLRGKEVAIREQHALLQAQHTSLDRTSAEAGRLREQLTATAERNSQLDSALDARAAELTRLQQDFDAKSHEAAKLSSTIDFQREEIDKLGVSLRELHQLSLDTSKKQSDELGRLREQLQKLEERVRLVEPLIPKPRRPLKAVLVDFFIGPQHYYPPAPRSLPGVTVVTVTHNDESRLRDTIESVLGQTHAHVQYVVVDRGSTDGTLAILDEYRDRITRIDAEVDVIEAQIKGYAAANYDVLGRLDPGDLYEPGALTRVAEHFRNFPQSKAVVFDEVVAKDGWRFPATTRETPDVNRLLESDEAVALARGIFVTNNAYKALSGITRERGEAAEWDFLIRLARRFGIDCGAGHVRATHGTALPAISAESVGRARQLFLSSFGAAGKVRCTLIHIVNRIDDRLRRRFAHRLNFSHTSSGRPLPTGVAPEVIPTDQPVSPLTGRLPDRLLFSTRDTTGGDDAISYVYFDSAADTAMVYPPIDLEKLQTIYRRDARKPGQVRQPDPDRESPYAGYRSRRGLLAWALSRVRSPYWSFNKPDFSDTSVAELLNSLGGIVPQRSVKVRFLNVACYEGGVLDALKSQTDWTLFGTETNPDAAKVARDKGFTIWETSAEDAALVLPAGEQFDVIYLGGLLEHLPDPLLVVRRLRQILKPGGRIVIDTPNLDSTMLDVFGPTWSLWQAPYHRTLLGVRGLKTLAKLASFRVERLRTRTHPLHVVRSVQLNNLGLGAVVPDTADFPSEVASRGVLITGWARLLWDWRGKGDYMYAVLRAE